MKTTKLLTALLAASALALPVQSSPSVVSGEVTHAGIQKLSSINWYASLGQAESEAIRQNKMIFYIHILGTIDGAT